MRNRAKPTQIEKDIFTDVLHILSPSQDHVMLRDLYSVSDLAYGIEHLMRAVAVAAFCEGKDKRSYSDELITKLIKEALPSLIGSIEVRDGQSICDRRYATTQ